MKQITNNKQQINRLSNSSPSPIISRCELIAGGIQCGIQYTIYSFSMHYSFYSIQEEVHSQYFHTFKVAIAAVARKKKLATLSGYFQLALAGVLVLLNQSKYPDLIVGAIVFLVVIRGAVRILKLGK